MPLKWPEGKDFFDLAKDSKQFVFELVLLLLLGVIAAAVGC